MWTRLVLVATLIALVALAAWYAAQPDDCPKWVKVSPLPFVPAVCRR